MNDMKLKKIRNIVTAAVFLMLIFGLAVYSVLTPDAKYSLTERRSLAQLPQLNASTLSDGSFADKFENYALDQFPARDAFRSLKAFFVKDILREKTCNGYYEVDGYISKLDYPKNQDSLDNAASVFENIYNKYLADSGCNVYLSVIPDKNYFLAEPNGYLSIDYDEYIHDLRGKISYAEYIDITGTLTIENYYHTDQHWRQETLEPTAAALLAAMGRPAGLSFEKVDIEKPFAGTYLGQSAFNVQKDKMSYLTNDVIESCTVTSYDTGKAKKTSVYPLNKLDGKDMYDVFLGGADALIIIENESAETDAELVVFRDSFGSSITPLMIDSYSKITLIDMRYIGSKTIARFVDFEDQDVLFMYSALILNNSFSFKK